MRLQHKLKSTPRPLLNPIGPGVLDPVNKRARIQFKGSRLLFDLETLCMLSKMKLTTYEKENWSRSQKFYYEFEISRRLDS